MCDKNLTSTGCLTFSCTTSCLLCFLTAAYPRAAIIFQGLITLDFSSHYIHMYASLTTGGQSHKKVDEKRSRLLHLYYTNRVGASRLRSLSCNC